MTASSKTPNPWLERLARKFRLIPFQRVAAVAVMLLLIGLPSVWADNEAEGLPPEITPLAAKYKADLDAFGKARSSAVAAIQKSYLTALGLAEQKAATEGKLDELNAVKDEKDAITAGRRLPGPPPPLLPRELATPRAYLQRELARAGHEYAVHAQQAAGEYLRGLAFYEDKARMAKQTDLLRQIEAEKAKLAGQNPGIQAGSPIAGRNLVINGDFAQKKEDGSPESWNPGSPGKGVVATEQGMNFLRITNRDKKDTYFLQVAQRPPGAQEVRVTARLRCRDPKVQGECGVIIAQWDGENNLLVHDHPCVLLGSSPAWKSLSGIVNLRPETKKVIIRFNLPPSVTTVDFADVRVEAR